MIKQNQAEKAERRKNKAGEGNSRKRKKEGERRLDIN